jgi:hypothetical protein
MDARHSYVRLLEEKTGAWSFGLAHNGFLGSNAELGAMR